jgi:hypothetical protein
MDIALFLAQASESNRLSHAYILSGNDAVQKNKLVDHFFFQTNIHVADQMRIEPEDGEIAIGQIRALSGFLGMSPWNSLYKTAVITHADTMNTQAQSAFLKILEEPKGSTVLFLITEYPGVLLETIRSRAQELRCYTLEADSPSDVAKKEFEKIAAANLHGRFAHAKKLAENPEHIPQTVTQWISVLRWHMLNSLRKADNKSAVETAKKIQTAQEILHSVQTTNMNSRLALERLFLDV